MKLIVHRPDLHDPVESTTPVVAVVSPGATKIRNLRVALRRWRGSGFAMTPGRERRIRSAICAVCPHWHGLGNLGLGECRAPGCGCTRAKIWLATEACPLGKWRAVSVPADQT